MSALPPNRSVPNLPYKTKFPKGLAEQSPCFRARPLTKNWIEKCRCKIPTSYRCDTLWQKLELGELCSLTRLVFTKKWLKKMEKRSYVQTERHPKWKSVPQFTISPWCTFFAGVHFLRALVQGIRALCPTLSDNPKRLWSQKQNSRLLVTRSLAEQTSSDPWSVTILRIWSIVLRPRTNSVMTRTTPLITHTHLHKSHLLKRRTPLFTVLSGTTCKIEVKPTTSRSAIFSLRQKGRLFAQ